jgi:type II secretory pathway component GspD/PulD (secretin)
MILNPDISELVGKKTLSIKTGDLATDVLSYDIPVIDKRTAATKVIVGTGQTLILGGLIKDKIVKNDIKVPFMGDIPILGNLFKTNNTLKQKTELLILVSPTLIDSAEMGRMAKQVRYGAAGQYIREKERQDKMMLIMENKENQDRLKRSSDLETLVRKQQVLSEQTKKLEQTVLAEENNVKKLEEDKEALLARKKNIGKK